MVDQSLLKSKYVAYAHEGKEFVKALEDGTVQVMNESYFAFNQDTGEIKGYSSIAPYDDITELIIPAEIGGVTVTKVGMDAFSSHDLIRVVMPSTVTVIEENAFADNKLPYIRLPLYLEEIHEGAFQLNQLTEVIIPDAVKLIETEAFADNNTKEIYLGSDIQFGGSRMFKWSMVEGIVNGSQLTVKEIATLLDLQVNADKEKRTVTIGQGKDAIKVVNK